MNTKIHLEYKNTSPYLQQEYSRCHGYVQKGTIECKTTTTTTGDMECFGGYLSPFFWKYGHFNIPHSQDSSQFRHKDWIGLDRTGPDWTGPDNTRLDQIWADADRASIRNIFQIRPTAFVCSGELLDDSIEITF